MARQVRYPRMIGVRVTDDDRKAIDEVRGHESISLFVMSAVMKEVELRRRLGHTGIFGRSVGRHIIKRLLQSG